MRLPLGPLLLALLPGCPGPWPDIVSCADLTACTTSGSGSTDDPPPTSGVHTVTGESAAAEDTGESGADTTGTTGAPDPVPVIVDVSVIPKYLAAPGPIEVRVATEFTETVEMQLPEGQSQALQAGLRPGEFVGEIPAYTGLDNGDYTAWLTPRSGDLVGDAVPADYVIALPPPGDELSWDHSDDGLVAAIALLPDGRPVELGTFFKMGEPRCYLHLRERDGASLEFSELLAPAHCRAIDLTIDRDSGVIRVLLARETDNGEQWWVGELAGWGAAPKQIGLGEAGDAALALASRPGLVAVCGVRPGAMDTLADGLVVLLRPDEPADPRLLNYEKPMLGPFDETLRDCAFADDDTLVLTGGVWGDHEENDFRERLAVIEYDLVTDHPTWHVAGLIPDIQSRATALDIDPEGFYHVVGYTCADPCAPKADVRMYAPGGALESLTPLGPLELPQFGPHDLAWSPAGYVVVALGGLKGQTSMFKVQAFAPDDPVPLWTYFANEPEGVQMALAVAVGPYGVVYAGGLGPAFAAISG
jgi:hypothetical protein